MTVFTDGFRSSAYAGFHEGRRAAFLRLSQEATMRGLHVMKAASAMFGRMMVERQRRRTQRIIDNLPDDVRKDIGWSSDRINLRD